MARLAQPACVLAQMLIAILLGGCARYQSYQPAPLAPDREGAAYSARRMSDPALARAREARGTPVSDSGWDSRQLALAALYFRPDLTEAQGLLAAARAGEITAGARPYPSASATVERGTRAAEGQSSPWTVSLAAGLTLERGGKRAARIERARALTLGARLRGEALAWQIAADARQAATAATAADVDLADVRAEQAQLEAVLGLLRNRFIEGQIARIDLARSEADVQSAAVATSQAARTRAETRSALARALALPTPEVERLTLRPERRSGCAAVETLSVDSLRAIALRTRPSIGAALADYAVSESDVRLKVAQQYPDLVVGPGITWDQGVLRWVLSLALPSILTRSVRGPIAEAEARRASQSARVQMVQDSVLAGVDSAASACRSATRDVGVTDSLVRASDEQLTLTRAAYQRGEIGKTELALAQLALVRAQRAQHQAEQRYLMAGAALEGATGLWPGAWLSGSPAGVRDPAVSSDMPTDVPTHQTQRTDDRH